MRSGTLHIASSLFFIFQKVSSIRKYADQILSFFIQEALGKTKINKEAMCKKALCMHVFNNFYCKIV